MKRNHPTTLQIDHARHMRKAYTDAEQKLWLILRNRRFIDHKFRRQVSIGTYIVDFVCFSHKLIIEADGSQHAENAHDMQRDQWLQLQGFTILRFWNIEILQMPQSVTDKIWHELHIISPSSAPIGAPSPVKGEGKYMDTQ